MIRPIVTKDQYGDEVPDDLVLIPDLIDLSDEEDNLVWNAKWYDVYVADGDDVPYLTVSAKVINYLSESEVEETVIEILLVNDVLKRFDENGHTYYHA